MKPRAERIASGPPLPVLLGVGVCFFATGAAGLIYEIVWSRMLALQMGNTSYALATLLTVFMGGLALGAWLGGHWAPAGRAALRTYGLLEIGIGLYCLLLPVLLGTADRLFAAIYNRYYGSFFLFNLMQFLVVGALLLIPTTMMGATLPVLTRFLVQRLGVMSSTVGVLYAVNSGGAFVGAMLAGLALLPALGVRGSFQVAVAINLIVGITTVLLSRLVAPGAPAPGRTDEPAPPPRRDRRREETAPEAAPPRFTPAVLLIGFGLSGFAAMVYQVSWTRAVTLAMGSSTYAFTIIAGAFILGLTLGSLLLGWIGDRPFGRVAIGLLPVLIGLSAVMTVAVLGNLPVQMTRLLRTADTFAQLEWGKFRAIFFMFLPATFCMGGLLPMVSRFVAHSRDEAARSVGNAYAANAVGTILGSFCGGFVFIPQWGMRDSILICAVLSVVVGAAFLYEGLRGRAEIRLAAVGAACAVAVLAVFAAPKWDPAVMTSGPFIKAGFYATAGKNDDESIRQRMRQMTGEILSYEESVSTVVTVTKDERNRTSIIVGGKPDAYSYASTQNWLGHLPLFLRPEAKRVLVIGLGSGHTAGSVARHPNVTEIDCVEISGGVARAAREYFGTFTENILDDPRLKLIIGDGRLHLEHTDRRYDVIISQPSNPWMAGASALFTRECFAAMRNCLEPGGVACIWFQGFRMPLENCEILARTWADVWPHVSVWDSRVWGEQLFIGSDAPLSVDFGALEAKLAEPRIAAQMNEIRIRTPAHMLSYLITVDDGVRAVGGNRPINTDDNSRIEYDTPRGMHKDFARDIYRLLHAQRVDPWDYVSPGASPSERFETARALGAQILADQQAIMQALGRPPAERRAQLLEVQRRNPDDPLAERLLKDLPRQ